MNLYEDLAPRYIRNARLWESAGKKLTEAQLTTDQINQLFAAVASGAAASGSNRTMLGKGVDAASSVNKAWEDLKSKVQNSGPIQNVDAMYDQAAGKLKQATGGDAGVMKYVQKYRDFAKAHPIAQSFIYAALIGAAGISGAGAGGAAALGLFKMADKLLQGEKFSSAAYAGAKTGAMAYGASKIGDTIKPDTTSSQDPTKSLNDLHNQPQTGAGSGTVTQQTTSATYNTSGITADQIVANPAYKQAYAEYMATYGKDGAANSAMTIQNAKKYATTMAKRAIAAGQTESVNRFIDRQLTEAANAFASSIGVSSYSVILTEAGVGQAIQGAANWMKTKAGNLTNKVTADKLRQQWIKDGSNTDSAAVAQSMQKAGATSDAIKQGMSSIGVTDFIPAATAVRAEPTLNTDVRPVSSAEQPAASTPTPVARPEPAVPRQQATAPVKQSSTVASSATPSSPASKPEMDYKTVVGTVARMERDDIDEIKQALDAALSGGTSQVQTGQTVDLATIRQKSAQQLAAGQAQQQQAQQQMRATAAGNVARSQEEQQIISAAQAAKAKPAFQQTATDKLAIKQARERGLLRDSASRTLSGIRRRLAEQYFKLI